MKNESYPPAVATAFGAFLVGLRAVVVSISARALPAGSGLVFARIPPAPPSRRSSPTFLQSWARETRTRVSSALRALGIHDDFAIDFDVEPVRGACLDLAILAACLGAVGRIDPADLASRLFLGELALNGRIQPVRGVLPIVRSDAVRSCPAPLPNADGGWWFVVPNANAKEAALASSSVLAAEHARDLIASPETGNDGLQALSTSRPRPAVPDVGLFFPSLGPRVLRALEIAAAGGHGIAVVGPPDARMAAARTLWSILTPPTEREIVEITEIHSAAGLLDRDAAGTRRPFRAPHSTIGRPESIGGLGLAPVVGGGDPPRPGEASLAHRGVLFLDEAPEFYPGALKALREVASAGVSRVVRRDVESIFPTDPENLVLGLAPCLCESASKLGTITPKTHERICTPEKIRAYHERALGPLRGIVDMVIRIDDEEIGSFRTPKREQFDAARARVLAAEKLTASRRIGTMSPRSRAEHVARTIADLDWSFDVLPSHVEEAEMLVLKEV